MAMYSTTPIQVRNLSDVIAISAGQFHTVALQSDGTVWAWGANSAGQLGNGTTSQGATARPVQAQNLMGITAISAGNLHTVALRNDGTAWAWGSNWSDQLGSGIRSEHQPIPTRVQNLTNITAIAAAQRHTVFLRNDGTVWAVGDNWSGQLGDGTRTHRTTPVQVQDLTNVTAIAATGNTSDVDWGTHTIALRSDGSVFAWGTNGSGELGDGTSSYWSHQLNEWIDVYRATPVQVLGPNGVGFLNLGRNLPFRDVGNTWYREAIEFVFWRDLMTGTSFGTFAPNGTLTRAAVATILHRLAGEPAVTFAPIFSDVVADRWYTNAVIWAAQSGIVSGIGDGRFAPNANITREQFATMLHRYAAFMDYDMSAPALGSHPDSDTISSWAEEAMGWAVYHHLITGTDTQGTLDPGGTATRAQCAVILQRFIVTFE